MLVFVRDLQDVRLILPVLGVSMRVRVGTASASQAESVKLRSRYFNQIIFAAAHDVLYFTPTTARESRAPMSIRTAAR